MPRIVATGAALPPHAIEAAEVRRRIPEVYGAHHDVERLLEIVDRAGIERRFLVEPASEALKRRPLRARNDLYIRHSRELGARALGEALERAGLRPRDLDILITTSCTGFAIPSLEAYLCNAMGLRPDLIRLPITELGCAAGAAGLARAADLVRARPGTTAAVLAVEIPSLTFQPDDPVMANVISSFLFGDGAIAAVVSGRKDPGPGAEIEASRSVLFEGTLDFMGFDLRDTGFHIVLAPQIPLLVQRRFAAELAPLLDGAGLRAQDLRFLALHPGGTRILEVLAESLGLAPERVAASRHVLTQYGNLSSASALFVYREILERGLPEPGAPGLMAAFGPGFAAEMLLLRWAS